MRCKAQSHFLLFGGNYHAYIFASYRAARSLSIIGGLLLLGTFLRAKVKLFQKLFLPASVIGGFIGLLLGPMVLGDYAILRVPETYINDWSLLPAP